METCIRSVSPHNVNYYLHLTNIYILYTQTSSGTHKLVQCCYCTTILLLHLMCSLNICFTSSEFGISQVCTGGQEKHSFVPLCTALYTYGGQKSLCYLLIYLLLLQILSIQIIFHPNFSYLCCCQLCASISSSSLSLHVICDGLYVIRHSAPMKLLS